MGSVLSVCIALFVISSVLTFKSGMRAYSTAIALALGLLFNFLPPNFAAANEIRVPRPLEPGNGSCCASGQVAEEGKIRSPGSIVELHQRWLIRYAQPVFCPMVTCRGSCAAYADACVLEAKAVLGGSSGCAGSCR